jgi:NTE family protein
MVTKGKPRTTGRRVGLAFAGGGPEGAIYEIGALRALDEAIDGLDCNALHVYVGVSAGAFIAANLANGITAAQMCRAIVKHEPGEHPFVPETFLTPAFREIARRGLTVPGLLFDAVLDYVRNPRDQSLVDALTRLGRALPVAVFDNEPIRRYLETIYSRPGRTDDFRKLERKLYVVASDLDSGEAICFGRQGYDDVPISTAVQASTALPGLYLPVEIGDRHYVDGVLLKTMHGSVALEAGADLLLSLNPIVPVDTARAVEAGIMRRGKLIDRGLPTVLSQALRTMVRSRLQAGLSSYRKLYRDADVVLLEPRRDDYDMFFSNIFSFSNRRAVCEHAYLSTREELLLRYEELAPIFERHGLELRRDVLEAPADLWGSLGVPPEDGALRESPLGDLAAALDRLEARLDSLESPPESARSAASP